MESTWTELELVERDAIWDAFYERFRFRPSMTEFPGLHEPEDSVTFSLSGMCGDEDRYWRVRRACEAAALAAFRKLVAPGGYLHVLDWQHPGYRFRPHSTVEVDHLGDWTVPLLPNGDYFFFLDPAGRCARPSVGADALRFRA